MKRFANTSEQEAIDKANEILAMAGLVITETQPTRGGSGAVIPTKGF
jgi:hypothetical protein